MLSTRILRNRRGIALMTTMLVAFAVSAIAIAAVMMTLNANLVGKNTERASAVDAAALAGVAALNLRLRAQEVGGHVGRTVRLYVATGRFTMRALGSQERDL